MGLVCAAMILAEPTDARAASFTWSSPTHVDTSPASNSAVTSMTCANANDCIAAVIPTTVPAGALFVGSVITTTDAAAGASTWSAPRIIFSQEIGSISCPSTALCIATANGQISYSTDPFGSSPSWSSPTAPTNGPYVSEMVCPSASLCLGLNGNLSWTTTPTAADPDWHTLALGGGENLNSLSCPTTTFCAVGDETGDVWTTSTPTGDPSAWSSVHIADDLPGYGGSTSALDVSCASISSCVAIDAAGRAFASVAPGASHPTWTGPRAIGVVARSSGGYLGFNPLTFSCPSADLCVALEDDGIVHTTTDATSANASWSTSTLQSDTQRASLACPSAELCVASDYDGNTRTTTDPAGGIGTWTPTQPINLGPSPYDPVSSSACPATNLCVAVAAGQLDTSTAPGQDTWSTATIDPSAALTAVSCADAHLCVAADSSGYVFWSQNPAGGAATWVRSAHSIDTTAQITGLSCPTEQLCVAVDSHGDVLTSTRPVGGAWPLVPVDVGYPSNSPGFAAISCTTTFCVAADRGGFVFNTSDPAGGGTTWSHGSQIAWYISSISCLPSHLCVASGAVETATTLNPAGGASAWLDHWNSNLIADPQPVAVSCAAITLCVGIGASVNADDSDQNDGQAIVSTLPRAPGSFTGPAATDQTIDPADQGPLESISCVAGTAGAQVCVVGDATGNIIAGTYPGTGTTVGRSLDR